MVEDTGIGIPEEQRKTIFGAFEQQNGQDHAIYGGTGLGLAITKRLTEMMGGRIYVSGENGQGSVFTVTLKNVRLVKQNDTVEKKNNVSADSIIFDKAVILIVDDIMNKQPYLILSEILIITDLGGGYAAERQSDIAWGFNPRLVIIYFFAP